MEQIHDLLEYKDIKIIQDSKSFKFSLDSVLLANFVTLNLRIQKILDIGTGNAPIPLILSRKTNSHILGIELQENSYKLAQKSVEINKLGQKINLVNQDIRQFYNECESDMFDVIVCNPPFFKYHEKSIVNESNSKTLARHEVSLTMAEIFKISKKLLKNGGKVAIVHRTERVIEIFDEMKKNNIEPKKIQFVYPKIGKTSNIVLVEGTKNGKTGLKVLDPLYVYDSKGKYTEEIKKKFR